MRVLGYLGLLLWLSGCGDSALHLKVRFQPASGLQIGDPVLLQSAQIGRVTALEHEGQNAELVVIDVDKQYASALTLNDEFWLADDAAIPVAHKRLEIHHDQAGGIALRDDTTVQGKVPLPAASALMAPLGDLLRGFGQGMRELQQQMQRFSQEMQKLDRSREAEDLRREWQRLQEQLKQAESSTSDAVRKDVLPQLRAEIERLRQRLQELTPPTAPIKPSQQTEQRI